MISKDDFVEALNEIEKVYKYHENLNYFFGKNGVDGYIYQPDCIPIALKLLVSMTNDNENDRWIEFFCFELDFGHKWKKGTITDKDGSDIKLETASDLYDYLLSLKK